MRFSLLKKLFLVASLHAMVGCATWTREGTVDSELTKSGESSTLPGAKIASGVILVDTAFIPIASDDPLWNQIDETLIDRDLRSRFAVNGIRVGHLIGSAANALDLTPTDASGITPLKVLENAGVASELSRSKRRIYCRADQPYRLPTRVTSQGPHSLFIQRAEGLSGKTLLAPDAAWEFSIRDNDRGRVSFKLKPVVEFGQARQNWIGQDQAIRLEAKRDQLPLDEFAFELQLPTNELLVIGPTLPAIGLGKMLFSGRRADGLPEQTILVLRAAHGLDQRLATSP